MRTSRTASLTLSSDNFDFPVIDLMVCVILEVKFSNICFRPGCVPRPASMHGAHCAESRNPHRPCLLVKGGAQSERTIFSLYIV